jgi:hypothetical protein
MAKLQQNCPRLPWYINTSPHFPAVKFLQVHLYFSLIDWFIHSSIHSFIHSCNHSLAHSLMLYLFMMFVTQTVRIWRLKLWIFNWKNCRKKRSLSKLKTNPSILLNSMRKFARSIGQSVNSGYSSRNLRTHSNTSQKPYWLSQMHGLFQVSLSSWLFLVDL